MLAHWIWLAHRPVLTDLMKAQILSQYGDPEQVYFEDRFENVEGLTAQGLSALQNKDLTEAHKILSACEEKHLHILTLAEEAYPSRLRQIPDPPLVLYYKGRLPDFDSTAVIGVVGTRHATGYGLQAARRLGYQLGKSGAIVVRKKCSHQLS